MPELPEVETVARAVAKAVQGQVIKEVRLNRPDLRFPFPFCFADRTENTLIKKVSRRGKYMLLDLDTHKGTQVMIWHLGMSGRVKIFPLETDYLPEKHDHFVMTLANDTRVVFFDPRRFGYIDLRASDSWDQSSPFKLMGPEPFDPHFTPSILYDLLQARKTPIKSALLDQHVIAGLGNIYVCEALYNAGISPKRQACNISKAKCALLHGAIKDVLSAAIEAGGSTLRDYKQTDGSLGYFQYGFSVYDREGRACPDCDCDLVRTGGIKRIIQAGRSTFYCPRRQR